MGIVKKNGIMIVDFALEAERQRGPSARRGDLRRLSGPFPSDPDDDARGPVRRAAARVVVRHGRRDAPAAWHRHHRRPDRFPGADALHDAGRLSRARTLSRQTPADRRSSAARPSSPRPISYRPAPLRHARPLVTPGPPRHTRPFSSHPTLLITPDPSRHTRPFSSRPTVLITPDPSHHARPFSSHPTLPIRPSPSRNPFRHARALFRHARALFRHARALFPSRPCPFPSRPCHFPSRCALFGHDTPSSVTPRPFPSWPGLSRPSPTARPAPTKGTCRRLGTWTRTQRPYGACHDQ